MNQSSAAGRSEPQCLNEVSVCCLGVSGAEGGPSSGEGTRERVDEAVEGELPGPLETTRGEPVETGAPRRKVGVGTSLEASVLITANLVDLGKPVIWAKAISSSHGKILERIGAHHVVFPEADAGRRVAHLVNGRLLDFIEFDDGFAIVKMRPPRETQGYTLAQSDIRATYGVTVVGVKSPGRDFTYATPETIVTQHDLLIVSGHTDLIERFSTRP